MPHYITCWLLPLFVLLVITMDPVDTKEVLKLEVSDCMWPCVCRFFLQRFSPGARTLTDTGTKAFLCATDDDSDGRIGADGEQIYPLFKSCIYLCLLTAPDFVIFCTYRIHGIKINNHFNIHLPAWGAKVQSSVSSFSGSSLLSFQLPVYYREHLTITADTCYSNYGVNPAISICLVSKCRSNDTHCSFIQKVKCDVRGYFFLIKYIYIQNGIKAHVSISAVISFGSLPALPTCRH